MVVRKSLRKWLTPLAFVPLAGCATFQDVHYEHSQKLRTECAYWHFKWTSDEAMTSDYKKGWKAGYMDVLTGGDGEPPVIPPRCYWGPGQITKHCDQKRQEWYVGFQDGAMMASLEPQTHYIKTWTPPATAHVGYYDEEDPTQAPPQSPPAVPPSEAPKDKSHWESAAPQRLPQSNPNLPPVPDQPEPF
ncbi:MAG TPA: hypothetical protein VNQ76_19885 [Planctomicrobium sp.]|nr:hypothetical protein [Planctomicrobium sp.]